MLVIRKQYYKIKKSDATGGKRKFLDYPKLNMKKEIKQQEQKKVA